MACLRRCSPPAVSPLSVGGDVGATEGFGVGVTVEANDGAADGAAVGNVDGSAVGSSDGARLVGASVIDGAIVVPCRVGSSVVGPLVGDHVAACGISPTSQSWPCAAQRKQRSQKWRK